MPYTAADGRTVYYYCESELQSITDLRGLVNEAQKYDEILENVAGGNFSDDEFPHNNVSIGPGAEGPVTWYRVADLCQLLYSGANTPCFNCGDIGSTIARNDIQQGQTGDCWFLCAVAAVSMVPELIKFVVPEDNQTNSAGVYHYRFWYEGAWVDIVVDDYVATYGSGDNIYTVGTNFYINNGQAEFWPLLLEKAYAKLQGSYADINGNVSMYALENLIGGFGVCVSDRDVPAAEAYDDILKWFDKTCIVCAGSRVSLPTTNAPSPKDTEGIVANHAYSVTGARIITLNDGSQAKLLRLRNPWGYQEWMGAWSDDSSLWDDVSQAQKDEIAFAKQLNGEFWIAYSDFLNYYDDISGCFYFPLNSFNQPGSKYQFTQLSSAWSQAQNTAGGFQQPADNPHFTVELSSDDGGPCLLIAGTVQLSKIYGPTINGAYFTIRLFAVPSGVTNFDKNFFDGATEIYAPGKTACSGGNGCISYCIFRHLPAGKYVIVPLTLNSGYDQKLCVRVFSEGKAQAVEVAPSENSGRAGSRSRSNSGQSAASGSRSASPASADSS